jgi:hypothetical protein
LIEHYVWLDFSQLTLKQFQPIDVDRVREAVVAGMVKDYAPFDVILTETKPAHGHYSHIKFVDGKNAATPTKWGESLDCPGCGGTFEDPNGVLWLVAHSTGDAFVEPPVVWTGGGGIDNDVIP